MDHPQMKIGIAGAGAMGCKFAWKFISAGYDLSIYEKDPSAAEALHSSGISVIDGDLRTVHPVQISTSPSILKDAGIVFLFVKSYSTTDAARELSQNISADSIVVSLQNGLGNFEALAGFFSPERIVYGSTAGGAAKTSGNEIVNGGSGLTIIGGMDSAAAGMIEKILNGAGFAVEVTPDPAYAVWKKAVVNSAVNPLGAILNFTNGEIINNSFSRELLDGITAESVSAAYTAGIELDADEMIASAIDICGRTSGNRCSMLQDISAGRRTEIDSINGIIIQTADAAGIPCPLNRSVYQLVKSLEAHGTR